jgi:hypothetical protein
MLLDQLAIFFDSIAVAASASSPGVWVGAYRGRFEPVNIPLIVNGGNATVVTVTVKVQESDDNTTFTDLGTLVLTKAVGATVFTVIKLPGQTRKNYVRLSYTASAAGSGTLTGLTIFAGVSRDDFEPYSTGLYIDNGKVVK